MAVCKINIDSDIRLAMTAGIRRVFAEKPEAFDPRVFLPPIMDTVMFGNIPDSDVAAVVECVEKGVKEAVGSLIVQFGSYGKAPLIEQVSLEQMAQRYKEAGI